MSKQFWGVIIVIILGFVGVFALSGNKSDSGAKKSSGATLTNHIIGPDKPVVTLVEYGDYQCPFCGQYYPTVKQAQLEFKDQVRLQFRNFPLVNAHPNAFAAARAAEAAALQNKFWEMHDMLYENQPQWSSASDAIPFFRQYAAQLNLDTTKFAKDFASSKVNDLINADMAEGTKLGISGTPTFFMNGRKLDISNSLANFQKVFKAEVDKKTSTH